MHFVGPRVSVLKKISTHKSFFAQNSFPWAISMTNSNFSSSSVNVFSSCDRVLQTLMWNSMHTKGSLTFRGHVQILFKLQSSCSIITSSEYNRIRPITDPEVQKWITTSHLSGWISFFKSHFLLSDVCLLTAPHTSPSRKHISLQSWKCFQPTYRFKKKKICRKKALRVDPGPLGAQTFITVRVCGQTHLGRPSISKQPLEIKSQEHSSCFFACRWFDIHISVLHGLGNRAHCFGVYIPLTN